MNEDETVNPYAAPQATSLAAPGPEDVRLRRPRSVKWATWILGLNTVALIAIYWQTIRAYGAEKVMLSQPLFDSAFLVPIGFVIALFGRGKFAYYSIATVLGMMIFKVLKLIWSRWMTMPIFHKAFFVGHCMELLLACGIIYLFYRVVFGLPSRSYFGVATPASDPAAP